MRTINRTVIALHRQLALLSLAASCSARATKPAWLLGTAVLSIAKILEDMEIGHNADARSVGLDAGPAHQLRLLGLGQRIRAPEAWKHSHNYVHHTFTNIRGKDKDLGYEIMRIDPHQPWHPAYLFQPFYNLVLAA